MHARGGADRSKKAAAPQASHVSACQPVWQPDQTGRKLLATYLVGPMKHVDMRKLPAAAQEERRRQVIGLRQAGMTYDEIAAQVGLSATGVLNICQRYAERGAA